MYEGILLIKIDDDDGYDGDNHNDHNYTIDLIFFLLNQILCLSLLIYTDFAIL